MAEMNARILCESHNLQSKLWIGFRARNPNFSAKAHIFVQFAHIVKGGTIGDGPACGQKLQTALRRMRGESDRDRCSETWGILRPELGVGLQRNGLLAFAAVESAKSGDGVELKGKNVAGPEVKRCGASRLGRRGC